MLVPTTTASVDGARDIGVFEIVMGEPPGTSLADGAMKTESDLAVKAWPNTDITEGLCWPCSTLVEGSGTGNGAAPGTAGRD